MRARLAAGLLPVIFLLFFSGTAPGELTPAYILGHMYDSIRHISTLRMKVSALERIERKFLSANSEIKLQVKPRKVYFINRARKLEVLYDDENMPGKALVKPNVFPNIPLLLDPSGGIMRRNQHYTIHELGFDFIGKSIALTLNKDKDGIRNFKYFGRVYKNGYHCYMLEYENRGYTYTDYKVGEKETATLIALRLCVNDYLLRYRNNLLNEFGFLKKGSILKVPTLYCKKAVLYIDERLMLPVSISLYDDLGIFESYDFSEIQVNRPFKPDEFSRHYKDYGF